MASRPAGPTSAGVPPARPTRVVVKLSPRSMEALTHAAQLGRLNHTDTLNRAVQLYDFVVAALAQSKDNALVVVRDGQAERVHLRW